MWQNTHRLGSGSVVVLKNGEMETVGEYVGGMGAHYAQPDQSVLNVGEIASVVTALEYIPTGAAYS
jgi:hypothetical protein